MAPQTKSPRPSDQIRMVSPQSLSGFDDQSDSQSATCWSSCHPFSHGVLSNLIHARCMHM
jgi:hypothetical protein